MEADEGMSAQKIYDELRSQFGRDFFEEIVPGIIHNFANPLNGIMGRSKLLNRRVEDVLKKVAVDPVGAATPDYYRNLAKDADLVFSETERLSDLLYILAEKFRTLSTTVPQKLDLSELLNLEMRFFEFHLEFKHYVKRTLKIEEGLPDVTGVPADFSIALSALIGQAICAMESSPAKEMILSTGSGGGYAWIEILHTGRPFPGKPFEGPEYALTGLEDGDGKRGILGALLLVRKYNARFEADQNGQWVRQRIAIPCG